MGLQVSPPPLSSLPRGAPRGPLAGCCRGGCKSGEEWADGTARHDCACLIRVLLGGHAAGRPPSEPALALRARQNDIIFWIQIEPLLRREHRHVWQGEADRQEERIVRLLVQEPGHKVFRQPSQMSDIESTSPIKKSQ